jgi:hypothetical protein
MGMSFGSRPCSSSPYNPRATAPNPDPARWELVEIWSAPNAFVIKARYLDCTNYEGLKIMVYRGNSTQFKAGPPRGLDPHFDDSGLGPIARFRPTAEGWRLACMLALAL